MLTFTNHPIRTRLPPYRCNPIVGTTVSDLITKRNVATMPPTPKAVAVTVALFLSLLIITQWVIDVDLNLTGKGTTFFKSLQGRVRRTNHTSNDPSTFTRKRPQPAHTDQCLVVFHIAKTGGTSMRRVVEGAANESGWKFHKWYGKGKQIPTNKHTVASYKDKATHVGHILPHFLDLTDTHKCKRMTILRDPIDRVVSLFYYQKFNESMWDECLGTHQYRNDMTRMFTGYGTVPGTWSAFGMQLLGNDTNTTSNANASASDGMNTNMNMDHSVLQDAKQFLLDTDLVCFLDDFDRCEADLRSMLKLEATNEVPPKMNVGRRKSKNITNELLSKITAVNELDVELFEWAVLNFHN
jgi:hypothetical protein